MVVEKQGRRKQSTTRMILLISSLYVAFRDVKFVQDEESANDSYRWVMLLIIACHCEYDCTPKICTCTYHLHFDKEDLNTSNTSNKNNITESVLNRVQCCCLLQVMLGKSR